MAVLHILNFPVMEVCSTSILTMIAFKEKKKDLKISALKAKPLFCGSLHQVINTIGRLPDCTLFTQF